MQACGPSMKPPEQGGELEEEEAMSFIFPVDLGRIDYEGGGIGPWGAHMGDHVEGLDHVWIDVLPDTPYSSTC